MLFTATVFLSFVTVTVLGDVQPDALPTSTQPQGCTWKVQGCYYDLQGGLHLLPGANATMTSAAQCRNFCISQGFIYAGMCNGNQCKCGNVFTYTPYTSTCCKSRCEDDNNENCGGPCYREVDLDSKVTSETCSIIISKCE